jgi:hypothetical protein
MSVKYIASSHINQVRARNPARRARQGAARQAIFLFVINDLFGH